MKIIQPKPNNKSLLTESVIQRVSTDIPIYFIRYRYGHHAAASGYDRLCDYFGETIELSNSLYWLGETILRPFCLYQAKFTGHYEYSRYDCVMEIEAIRHFLRHSSSIYHFIYADKSFRLMRHFAHKKRNILVGTIHHPVEHNEKLFRSLDHFKVLDHLVVMSPDMIPYWEHITGRKNVYFVPHGVDVEYYYPLKKQEDRSLKCLFVGSHERDFGNLPKIVSAILTTRKDVEFHIVSSEPRCENALINHQRIFWYRRLSENQYYNLLRSSDLMVLPLIRSTACNAVLEGLACGIPIVSNKGGIEAYLSPDCSICVDIGDTDGFIASVQDLLLNEDKLKRMQVAARLRAIEFSWPEVAKRMIEIYRGFFSNGYSL